MNAEAVPGQERDLSNAQLVGRKGTGEVIVQWPRAQMTRDQALVHAAWLVLVAEGEDEFGAVLAAVRSG